MLVSCNQHDTFDVLNLNVGITFSSEDLAVWRERANNGPYKTTGDRFSYSPGAWDDVVDHANDVINGVVDDYRKTALDTAPGANVNANNALCVAFYYLIKQDLTYGNWAKKYLLSQIRESVADWTQYSTSSPLNSNLFFAGPWWVRLFNIYDYTKDLYSASEIIEIETWLSSGAEFFKEANHNRFVVLFPNRLSESYNGPNDRKGIAKTEVLWDGSGTSQVPWTHGYPTANRDDWKNPITYVASIYHNATSMSMVPVALWGCYKNDVNLKLHARLYTEEVIKYHVWPDGTAKEYTRNGDYGYQSQGTGYYWPIMVEAMVYTAELFRKHGDLSIWNYTTTEGLGGTEVGGRNGDGRGQKSIRDILEVMYENQAQTIVRHSTRAASNGKTVLDNWDGNVKMFTPEQVLALANLYLKDPDYISAYLHIVGPPFFSGMGLTSSGGTGVLKWGGMSGMFAALPLQYYDR